MILLSVKFMKNEGHFDGLMTIKMTSACTRIKILSRHLYMKCGLLYRPKINNQNEGPLYSSILKGVQNATMP